MSGVSREDVTWCFERLLGRVLDDEEAIQHFMQHEPTFESLVRSIAYSVEFRNMKNLACRPGINRDGFNYDDKISTQKRILQVLRSIPPRSAEGFSKTRIGAESDGGYVMLNDFSEIEAAYSLGINQDVTWDKDIATYGIDIYQYDHTIDALPEENDRFKWFKIGISDKKEGNLDTLPNLILANGHENSKNLILKCDIEGHEWKMLAGMTPKELGQFRQIVLETHGWCHMDRDDFAAGIERSIANLVVGHSLIHVHGNNYGAYVVIGGVPIPAALEMTFVRNNSYILKESNELFPTYLDNPCNSKLADFHLGHFRF